MASDHKAQLRSLRAKRGALTREINKRCRWIKGASPCGYCSSVQTHTGYANALTDQRDLIDREIARLKGKVSAS